MTNDSAATDMGSSTAQSPRHDACVWLAAELIVHAGCCTLAHSVRRLMALSIDRIRSARPSNFRRGRTHDVA
jgi:hypothetical protein